VLENKNNKKKGQKYMLRGNPDAFNRWPQHCNKCKKQGVEFLINNRKELTQHHINAHGMRSGCFKLQRCHKCEKEGKEVFFPTNSERLHHYRDIHGIQIGRRAQPQVQSPPTVPLTPFQRIQAARDSARKALLELEAERDALQDKANQLSKILDDAKHGRLTI
jgi:hypothetical protein